jgi:hypothetical protein
MKDVFDTEAFKTKSGILPRWVDIHPGVGGGLGFVYHDNLVVLCDDQNTADVVVARITQNPKALQMAIKDKKDAQGNAVYGLKAWSHKEIAEQGAEFLGLHFQLQRKYGRNRYGSFTVRQAKTRERATLAVPATEATCRELASFVGKMGFTAMLPDAHLHGSPLGSRGGSETVIEEATKTEHSYFSQNSTWFFAEPASAHTVAMNCST